MRDGWVRGEGPGPCRLMVVGEAPGKDEMATGRPFVGMTGVEVNNLLRNRVGIPRHGVYVTNLCKRFLGEDKKIDEEEMEMWGELLREEIEKVQPSVILALGAISTYWFLGDRYDMETVNALPHEWEGRIVVPSFHPAAAFRDTSILQWVIEAFDTAQDVLIGNAAIWNEGRRGTKIVGHLAGNRIVALDTETLVDGTPFLVSGSDVVGQAVVRKAEDAAYFARAIKGKTVLLHNALFDLPVLARVGIRPERWIDTMHIAFLLQTLPLGLKNLAYKLCGMRMKEYEEVRGDMPDLDCVPEEEVRKYAAQDADATLRVYNDMLPRWYSEMDEVLERDMEIMPTVIAMMEKGMLIDPRHFTKLEHELVVRMYDLQYEIERIAEDGINPASAPQVAKLLYEKLGLGRRAKIKKTKWGGSTDKNSMKKMKGEHPVIRMIEEWRELDTLVDKFITVIPKKVDKDGRVHTKISLVRVKHSGRLASSNPNLMAQPTRTEDGRRVRDGFVAAPGYELVSFDYNQIEMRLMAHLSQDPVMLQVYRTGGDIHTDTAMRTFGIARAQDVDEMKHRYPAKRTGFGVINLITAHGLARELADGGAGLWGEAACQEFLDIWFATHPGVKEFFDRTIETAKRQGYITDMWGRMEYIPEFNSCHNKVRAAGERKAVNQQIQSGAQGIIKEAMRRIWPWARAYAENGMMYPLMQIHDDLLWEVREGFVKEASMRIMREMEEVVKLSIPITVEVKRGKKWGSTKKMKGSS